MRRPLSVLLLPLLLGLLLLFPSRVWAGPVSWKEVAPTAEGRQWWDEGSLRRNRSGHLTVLSRFQAALEQAAADGSGPSSGASAAGDVPATDRGAVASAVASGPPVASRQGPGSGAGLTASQGAPTGSLPAGLDQRAAAASRSAPPISRLYVMELDCDQSLYRDISINGLPQFRATWQPTGSDDLTAEVLRQACAAEAA
jgi:hypothetical protein